MSNLGKEFYANCQRIWTLTNDKLTFYYKSGKIKATGLYLNNMFQGEWNFYAENGLLQQIGNFLDDKKHGSWQRFDKSGAIVYDHIFENGKIIKL